MTWLVRSPALGVAVQRHARTAVAAKQGPRRGMCPHGVVACPSGCLACHSSHTCSLLTRQDVYALLKPPSLPCLNTPPPTPPHPPTPFPPYAHAHAHLLPLRGKVCSTSAAPATTSCSTLGEAPTSRLLTSSSRP